MDNFELIERLGGWGVMATVLLFVVRWMLRRADKALEQMDKALTKFGQATDQFQKFEASEDHVHTAILNELREIKLAVRSHSEWHNESGTKG